MRGAIPGTQNRVSLQFRAIDPPNPARGFIQQNQKMCVSLQRRKIKNFKMHVSLQRRAPKCMKQVSDIRHSSRHTKIIVLPQFWRFDDHEVTRHTHFTTVLNVRRARSDERVRGHTEKFAFHHSFERPTFTFCVKGCFDS